MIKQDAKGKGKDLTVKKNQRVIIICMDKRVQKGKWLVKLEDDEGSININCLVLLLQIDM
jgi:hypothetical protein